MTRFPPLTDDRLDVDQQRMADAASHDGPYHAFLRAPLLWERLQPLRRYLAEMSVLDVRTREAVILRLARFWRSTATFAAHRPLALAAGLTPIEIGTIGRGETVLLSDPAAQIALECAGALLSDHRLSDDLFARATELLGERGLVELVGLIGFFTTIALTLNVAGLDGDAPFANATGAYSPADESETRSGRSSSNA